MTGGVLARIARLHLLLLQTLGALAALLLPAMTIAVIYDVTLRNSGLQPPSWPDQMVEYSILWLAVLAAPLITRRRGHVFISSVRNALPARVRPVMNKVAAIVCAALCGFMTWYLARFTAQLVLSGEPDAKGFDMPRWVIMAPVLLSFLLMTIEFVRFAVTRHAMYPDDSASAGH